MHVPAAEIFKKVSKYFGILLRASLFYSQAAIDLHIYIFSYFLLWFDASFYTRNHWRLLYLKICTLVKGEESLHPLDKISKPSLLFIINSDMFSSSVISVISLSMAE